MVNIGFGYGVASMGPGVSGTVTSAVASAVASAVPTAVAASIVNVLNVKVLTANLAQAAGTYDLATATGGDMWIEVEQAYISTAGAGFTTAAVLTNHAVPKSIVAALSVIGTTLDLVCTLVTTKFVLPSGKKLQYTLVGAGSAGAIQLVVKTAPVTVGATLV